MRVGFLLLVVCLTLRGEEPQPWLEVERWLAQTLTELETDGHRALALADVAGPGVEFLRPWLAAEHFRPQLRELRKKLVALATGRDAVGTLEAAAALVSVWGTTAGVEVPAVQRLLADFTSADSAVRIAAFTAAAAGDEGTRALLRAVLRGASVPARRILVPLQATATVGTPLVCRWAYEMPAGGMWGPVVLPPPVAGFTVAQAPLKIVQPNDSGMFGSRTDGGKRRAGHLLARWRLWPEGTVAGASGEVSLAPDQPGIWRVTWSRSTWPARDEATAASGSEPHVVIPATYVADAATAVAVVPAQAQCGAAELGVCLQADVHSAGGINVAARWTGGEPRRLPWPEGSTGIWMLFTDARGFAIRIESRVERFVLSTDSDELPLIGPDRIELTKTIPLPPLAAGTYTVWVGYGPVTLGWTPDEDDRSWWKGSLVASPVTVVVP